MKRILEKLDDARLDWRSKLERAIEETSSVEHSMKLDASREFDSGLYERLGQLGVFGLGVPESEGGAGGDTLDQVITLEVLGRHSPSMAVFGVVSFLVTRLLRQYGTGQQKAWMRSILTGSKKGAFCLTEASGGTDVLANIGTTAVVQADQWVLNGSKAWISGADDSDMLLVVARTASDRKRGLTVFVVPTATQGVQVVRQDTMALNSYPTCAITLSDVRIPISHALGEVDNGLPMLMGALNGERINAASVVNGVGRGALQLALKYVSERHAFGRPIGEFQAVQHRLANAAIAVEQAWATVLEAARQDAAGEATDVLSSLAKWSSSKAALSATDVGMEVMGAAGFLSGGSMQRYFRDARLHVFAPVNNDMILNLMSERWLGLGRSY